MENNILEGAVASYKPLISKLRKFAEERLSPWVVSWGYSSVMITYQEGGASYHVSLNLTSAKQVRVKVIDFNSNTVVLGAYIPDMFDIKQVKPYYTVSNYLQASDSSKSYIQWSFLGMKGYSDPLLPDSEVVPKLKAIEDRAVELEKELKHRISYSIKSEAPYTRIAKYSVKNLIPIVVIDFSKFNVLHFSANAKSCIKSKELYLERGVLDDSYSDLESMIKGYISTGCVELSNMWSQVEMVEAEIH